MQRSHYSLQRLAEVKVACKLVSRGNENLAGYGKGTGINIQLKETAIKQDTLVAEFSDAISTPNVRLWVDIPTSTVDSFTALFETG